jgi:hypothetical protein
VITVDSQIVSLFLFPDGAEVFNCLKYETTLIICEFAVLPESVQTNNVFLRLDNEGFFIKLFPFFNFGNVLFTSSFLFLFDLLLFLLPV